MTKDIGALHKREINKMLSQYEFKSQWDCYVKFFFLNQYSFLEGDVYNEWIVKILVKRLHNYDWPLGCEDHCWLNCEEWRCF